MYLLLSWNRPVFFFIHRGLSSCTSLCNKYFFIEIIKQEVLFLFSYRFIKKWIILLKISCCLNGFLAWSSWNQ